MNYSQIAQMTYWTDREVDKVLYKQTLTKLNMIYYNQIASALTFCFTMLVRNLFFAYGKDG